MIRTAPASGSPVAAVAATPAPLAPATSAPLVALPSLRAGTRLTYVDLDAHSGASVGETTLVVRKQAKVISGQRFEATRVRLEGYASRAGLAGGGPSNGAFFEGEALVDNATGIVLELNILSRSSLYLVRRELVRVVVAS